MQPLDLSDYQPDDSLSEAKTIPSRWYTDSLFLQHERTKIFHKTWQLVASRHYLLRSGDYFCCDLMGEPLVLTRNQDDKLLGFYNVCRHRAGRVAQGKGNRKTLQCQYHGWTYDLNGHLKHAPEFNIENYCKQDFCLRQVKVEEWGPFVFVNLDPNSPPLQEFLGKIPAEIAEKGFAIDAMEPVERRDYHVNCNWKVYVDNYLEGYHIPIAHPGLYRELDYKEYRVDTFRYYSSQHAPFRPVKAEEIPGRDRRFIRTKEDEKALYYWLFPNIMLNFYPDNLQVNIVLPIDHKKTLTIFEWYFQKPGSGEGWESMQKSIAFSDEVQKEDIELCEAVQQGLESQSYDWGRFCVKRENGVYHFQKLVHEFLSKA